MSSSGHSRSTDKSSLGSALHDEAEAFRANLHDIEDVELPGKRDVGKTGRKIKLSSNYYRVAIQPNVRIYQFDVKIQEDNAILGKESVSKTDEKRAFFQAFMAEKFSKVHDKVCYDGQASMYFLDEKAILGKDGPDSGVIVKFQYAPRGPRKRDFTVTLRRVNDFNSNEINAFLNDHREGLRMDAIQALDVVFRHRAGNDTVQVGRSFFPAQQPNARDIGSGREVWFGYHQSLKAIQGKSGGTLALNIDAAAKAFLKTNLGWEIAMDVLRPRNGPQELGDKRFFNDGRRKQLEKYISKIQFTATHLKNNKLWRCSSLSREGAAQKTFTNSDGRTINVADYYKKQYGINLDFPFAPLIQVGNAKSPNVKFFPLELMRVAPRQPHRGKVDEMMQSNMIKAIADPAPKKQQIIDGMARRAIEQLSPMAQLYGVKTSAKMEDVTGRVLPAPGLEYAQKKKVTPREGAWDARREKFFQAKNLDKWVAIKFQVQRMHDRQLEEFCQGLCRAAGTEGMQTAPPQKLFNANSDRDLFGIFEKCKENGINFALIILPRRDSAIYSMVKASAELEYGVQTQCVQARNVERANAMFYGNLLQKINTKLGGTNTRIAPDQRLRLFAKPAMVVGISFSHPAPGSRSPSVVSASFSFDASATKYFCSKRLQRGRFALATGLKELILDGLKGFYQRCNKMKPERILVFRNGASEGELQQVAKLEVKQIKDAFAALPGEYNPSLTVIVVNKRTHTRMFAQDRADQIGKSGNVPSGTVVDTGVVSKNLCDWYINSSQGIQGTSRPVHYTLVHDENNLDADNLQMLSWHLCHAYARCTRTVSIPIPCLYADLVNERVNRYLQSKGYDSDAGSVHSQDSREYDRISLNLHKDIPDMHFV